MQPRPPLNVVREITSQTCPRRVLGASTCNRVAQDLCLFGGYSGEIWVFEPLLEVHILGKKKKKTPDPNKHLVRTGNT